MLMCMGCVSWEDKIDFLKEENQVNEKGTHENLKGWKRKGRTTRTILYRYDCLSGTWSKQIVLGFKED